MRRLIINADDFGLTSGVNRGIIAAHTRGIVTSATLMACGSRFQEAVALAQQTPTLSVGCHVLLVDASPVRELQQVSSLAVASSGVPRFRDSLVQFACLAVARRLSEEEVEAEIIAQIRKLQSPGVQVTHLDSHKHTHIFPAVFRPMLRAARKCGIRAVRNPFEPLLFASFRDWKRRFQLGILRSLRSSFRRALNEAGMLTPDGCIGIIATGGLTLAIFRQLIEHLPDGTWEFVTHPGYNDSDLSQVKTRLRSSRETELGILTSAEARDILDRERIKLISYRDFARPAGRSLEVPAPSTTACD